MIVRALLIAALIFPLGAASAAPSHLWGPAAPTLTVRAGVGGAARPGRWLPVDVTVTSGDAPLRGAVSVEWGGAIARRDIDLGALSTERVPLLLRTIAASPGVRVTLTTSDGAIVATTDTPLTLVASENAEPVRVCVGDVAPSTTCSVRIPEAEAPANARALDFADQVVWNRTAESPREPARALALWQAVRWWQDSGSVDPIVAPFDTISRLADRTALSLTLFVMALLLATSIATWRRAPALMLIGIPLAVAGAGLALVTRSSRDVDIQAAAFVHQFDGVPQSALLMKGEVEHPGTDALVLAPALTEASLDIAHGLQHTESAATADGRPVYRNTAGRGARSRFELRGSLDRDWLAVTTSNGELAIENRAPFALTDCEIRSADVLDIGTVAAGATSRTARSAGLAPGDSIVCALPAGWLEWSAPRARVRTRGSAFLVFHAWPGAGATSEPRASR